MKDGKYSKRRRGVSSKALALTLAVMLVIGCAVGGTLAWLTDKTDAVQNTFTTSDVDIKLEETGMQNNKNSYKMVPGNTITKDPKVTVVAGSEKAYVFVKVETSTNFGTYMTYDMDTKWTKLTGVEGVDNVWYQVVDASTTDTELTVIKDNKVSVKGEVTKTQMDALTSENYPTLTVTAYACQYMKDNNTAFTAAEAWTNVNTNATPNA